MIMQDDGYLPEVTISKKDCRARAPTYSPVVFTKDERHARPALPTLPGMDRTIGGLEILPRVATKQILSAGCRVIASLIARSSQSNHSNGREVLPLLHLSE